MHPQMVADLADDTRAMRVLDLIKDEHRVNPLLVRQETDLSKGDVNTVLVQLAREGYIQRRTEGLYEFVDDPRKEN